ncbi:hypothetical protein [Streptomyces sp. NPDC057115]|uniref:hypothetical protein n=1 Tax=unclassified Streptomyces TaxID=2593676 RepID=UPI00363B2949
MSSTYRVLCLSHDPATAEGEYATADEALAAIAEGLPAHPGCDLMVGRYSYPLVEVGCPPTKYQPASLACTHGAAAWTDSTWLRLLLAALQSSDLDVLAAAVDGRHTCFPWARLHRLRAELGVEEG